MLDLTMVDTAKHVISNLVAANQILLENSLVPQLINLLEEEPLEVPKILLSACASLENTGHRQVVDKVVLNDHGASLILAIPLLVPTDDVRSGTQRPEGQCVVNNVIVQIYLKSQQLIIKLSDHCRRFNRATAYAFIVLCGAEDVIP